MAGSCHTGPVKFHVGYYDYNSTDIILIPEHAKEFDNYCGFAFPRICNGEIYLRMLMHDAVMGFYFIRPGQKPSDKRVSSMSSQTVMGPAAMKQPSSFAMMGKPLDPPPKFCRHCGSPVKPGDKFCRQCGGNCRSDYMKVNEMQKQLYKTVV